MTVDVDTVWRGTLQSTNRDNRWLEMCWKGRLNRRIDGPEYNERGYIGGIVGRVGASTAQHSPLLQSIATVHCYSPLLQSIATVYRHIQTSILVRFLIRVYVCLFVQPQKKPLIRPTVSG